MAFLFRSFQVFLTLAAVDATAAADAGVRVVVNTTTGPIAGKVNGTIYETRCPVPVFTFPGSTNIAAFLGIPYAAAPVGELRFKPTEPRKPWSSVLEASKPGPVCPQLPGVSLVKVPKLLYSVNEDCLFLNMWAPTSKAGTLVGSRPTMLFFHGGCFMTGSGYQEVNCAFYNGQGLARDMDAIVVTINYRLGIFGFFADPQLLAESGTTGNYGLQDQRSAMTWVKNNIAAFGGDPSRITIIGESAGATSVLHHLVIPRSKELFAQAISQSGYDLTWSLESAYARGELMSKAVGCSEPTSRLQCLRKLSAKDVLAGQAALFFQPGYDWLQRALTFGPVSDGFELPTNVSFATILSEAKIEKPLIIGSNLNESNLIFCLDHSLEKQLDTWDDALAFVVKSLRRHIPESPATDADIKVFFGHYSGFATPLSAVMAAMTDTVFTCPARRIAGVVSNSGKAAYRYLFSRAPKIMQADKCLGVPHAADLMLLFYKAFPANAARFILGDATEQALASATVSAWGSFLRNGTPEPVLDWHSWNNSEPTLQLGLESPDKQLTQVIQGYQQDICKFIDERIQPIPKSPRPKSDSVLV